MQRVELWDPYASVEQTTLLNGLNIYFSYWNRPWVHIRVVVHSGYFSDSKEKAGLAQFAEHMISMRTGELSFSNSKRLVEKYGGFSNFGQTDGYKTHVKFDIPLLGNAIEKVLARLGKMFMLDPEETLFEREKKVVMQEYLKSYPTPIKYELSMKPYKKTFKGTRLEGFRGSLGNPQTVATFEFADIVKFFCNHYTPANMSIIVAGGAECPEINEMIKSTMFALVKSGKRSSLPTALVEVSNPDDTEEIFSMSKLFGNKYENVAAIESYLVVPAIFSRKACSILKKIWEDVLFREIREATGAAYITSVEWEYMVEVHEFKIRVMFDYDYLNRVKSILGHSVELLRNKRAFWQKKLWLIKSHGINDLNMSSFCSEIETDLVKHNRIIASAEELQLLKDLSFQEYLELVDYVSDLRRWYSMVFIP